MATQTDLLEGDAPQTLVLEGPELNASRNPFDKKVYRHIMLPNGLRALLVSDTNAMSESWNSGEMNGDLDDDRSDNEEIIQNNEPEKEDDNSDDTTDHSVAESDETDGYVSEGEECGIRSAAAAMIVGVGSFYDDPNVQGMAHFLEHLLMMGSARYPEENAYDKFISKHGGSDNAYTESEHTVYHFDIPQEYLKGGLDIFSQFFIHPLMMESSVERELNSIESEFQLVKNSDSCRLQQLMCHTCGHKIESLGSDHPMTKFSWGNLKSLRGVPAAKNICPLKKLREFFDEHYYASNMRLVLIGAYSLDTLQDYVIQCFSDVPQRGSSFSFERNHEPKIKNVGMPFTKSSLEKVYYIVPVSDRHAINITWQMPSQMKAWRTKPCDYLAHLIGHEAEGSLLASLKSRSWATGCCAGVGSEGYENASSHALFMVSITLSEEGIMHWQEIVAELYQYVGMLRYYSLDGLPSWIFQELKVIQEISYKYEDEPSPEDCVETLAEMMAPEYELPAERLLDGIPLLFEFDPMAIKDILDNYFIPANGRIDVTSSKFGRSADFEGVETSEKDTVVDAPLTESLFDPDGTMPLEEPMFGTHYWCQMIPTNVLHRWKELSQAQLPSHESSLSLPKKNEFIPSKFDLKSTPAVEVEHPLLNCLITLKATAEETQWSPVTVTQYDVTNNSIVVSLQNGDKKWHKVDHLPDELTPAVLSGPQFEGSLDDKKVKFRIITLAIDGKDVKLGDDCDVGEDSGFPPVPASLPPWRLPQLVCNTNTLKFWHLQDRNFKRPVAELRTFIYCAEAGKSPLHAACSDLLVRLISDSLNETVYVASMCELSTSIGGSESGFSLRVHGFDDKLMALFSIMLGRLLCFRGDKSTTLPREIRKESFELCLESYRRRCINAGMKASNLASDIRVRCLRSNSWSANEKLKALSNLDIPTFLKTVADLLRKIGLECLYHGNVDFDDAKVAQAEILRLMEASGGTEGLSREEYPNLPVSKVPNSADITVRCAAKDPKEPNQAVEVYFQVGKDNTLDRVLVDLLTEMMYEPLFDQVRTRDQFGYHVSCDSRWTDGVIGIHIQVVSSSKTATEIDARIEEFLTGYRQTLADMSPEDFVDHLSGLAKQKLEAFNSLSEQTGHFWSEIRDGRYQFQVERDEVLQLKHISQEQALEAYDKWLYPNGSNKRRRFSVNVVAVEALLSEYPLVNQASCDDFNDEMAKQFQSICKHETFGQIY